jgi:heterodisulfide reductase subunit C
MDDMEVLKQFLKEQDLPQRARACYQCGVCAGGCPVGRWRSDFNPRLFVLNILRDDITEILDHHSIWLCTSCLTCLERCPQKIEVSEIVVQLKNAAARNGNAAESEVKKHREIMKTGWLQNPTKRILRVRQELGLPELPEGIGSSELNHMASRLDWQEKMETLRKRGAQMSAGHEDHDESKKRDSRVD